MRHPGAVVESQLRFAEYWDPFWVLERYTADETLMQGALRPYAHFLKRGLSRAGALTANWCIENLVPASEAAQNNYCVVFYEELLEQPQAEWRRLTEGLGLKDVPNPHLLNEPSQQSAQKLRKHASDTASYQRSYSHWRERLPSGVLEQIASVLDAFGVNFYSVPENRPDVRGFMRAYQLKAGLPTAAALVAGGEITEP
jgi:hypothetical protein